MHSKKQKTKTRKQTQVILEALCHPDCCNPHCFRALYSIKKFNVSKSVSVVVFISVIFQMVEQFINRVFEPISPIKHPAQIPVETYFHFPHNVKYVFSSNKIII